MQDETACWSLEGGKTSWALISIAERWGESWCRPQPLGRTWGVAGLWSDNSPPPEGGAPNWNVFWQRDSRCFGRTEAPSGNRENWDVGEKVRWSEAGCCSDPGSNKLNPTDESRRLSAATMTPWRKERLEHWSVAGNTHTAAQPVAPQS